MPQQAFRRHDDQRFAPGSQGLAAQQMKVLGWRRRISDLDVIAGSELQEALEPGARMFRPLSFQSMRQQHYQPAQALPFILGAGDELIDNRLCCVPEISVLRLPKNQTIRAVERVTVFESEHASF